MESSINLISANRLDVFTKTPLAYAWANRIDQSWGLELYMRYMLATRPKNGFSEDNSKFSINDYLNSFRSIFNSIESVIKMKNDAEKYRLASMFDLKGDKMDSSFLDEQD